jgi:Zn-dependent M16 (insulinase) family peptidase
MSRYSVNGFIGEQTSGITYLKSVKQYLDMAENDFPALLAKLEGIRSTILKANKCRDGMIMNLVADEDVLNESKDDVEKFLNGLPGDASPEEKFTNFYSEEHPWATQAKAVMGDVKNEGFVVPTQVNYVGQGARLYDVGEKMKGSASVIARHLRTGYLWDTVRVIGGAYGGFCTLSGGTGIFTFLR